MRNSIKIVLLISMMFLTDIVSAQVAGDRISGVVVDDQGPISMVNVVEIDATNRIVTHDIADINGAFSFQLKSPNNKIRVAYVGYKTALLKIDKTYFRIKLESNTTLKPVEVTAKAVTEGTGLIIPIREVSGATQKIDATEFEGFGITTIDEALQGRISGLDIVTNSGNLGAGTSMRLRGAASISGSSEPLVVVDGNVLASEQLNTFDFTNANDEKFAQLLNVNPEDIQSITVLKDAASTAIWGSQGANGVIEIKTKRGVRGATKVGYTYRVSGNYQPSGMKMLNGDQYTMLLKEEYFNPTLNDAASNIRELNYDPSFSEYQMYNNNTDWISAVKQVGMSHSHNINLSGGGEKANFRIAAGYDKQFGSIIEQSLDRFTTRVGLDYFVSDRIKFTTNFDMSYTDNNQNADGLLSIAFKKMPNLAIYEEDAAGRSTGKYYQVLSTASNALADQKSLVNPLASAEQAKSNSSSLNLTPVFEIRYNLLGLDQKQSSLVYTGRIAFSVYNTFSSSFYPSSLSTGGWSSGINRYSNSANKSQGINSRHQLTFSPKFANPDHVYSTLFQFETNSSTSNSQSSGKTGLPNIETSSAEGTISSFGTGIGESRSMNFASQNHYAYKGKYIADFTVRADATTKLGPSKRWKVQPSLSFRWNAIDEEFMKSIPWISMLAIRPSIGITGGQPGSEYLFYSRYGTSDAYNGESSMAPLNIRLSDLKMETLVRYNLGFNFGFLDDKITANFDIYKSVKTDMLQGGKSIATSSGYSSLSYMNNGSLQNTGWDLNIDANKFVKAGKFSMDFNLALNNNSNELLTLDQTILNSLNGEFNRSNGSYVQRVQLKNALGSIYGFKYKGVYQYSDYSETEVPGVSGPKSPVVRNSKGEVVMQDNGKAKPMYFCYGTVNYEFKGGDAMYEDINHDGNINELDIVYLGSSLPLLNGGFGFRLRYGNFSMNNQFNFRLKQRVVNMARMNAEKMYSNENQCLSVNWRWRVEGDNTSIPRALYAAGYNWLGSDRFVEDASFMRLNFMNFAYSMDPKLIKPLGLRSLSLSLSLNNLFVITKYSGNDPEVGFGGYNISTDGNQTPRSKSFNASIIAQF